MGVWQWVAWATDKDKMEHLGLCPGIATCIVKDSCLTKVLQAATYEFLVGSVSYNPQMEQHESQTMNTSHSVD